MAGSDWLSYTPTWTSTGTAPTLGNGTITGQYRRVGDSIDVIVRFVSGSTSTAGTGKWQFTIPSGLTINESKLNTTNNRPIGFGIMQNFAGSDHVFISPTYITSDSNKVRANVYYISSSRLSVFDQIGPTEPGSFVAGQCNITLSFSVPIVGFTAGGPGLGSPNSMIRLSGGNGYGSTNTKIRRYTTTVSSSGSDITLTQSATNGDSFTINTAGVYSFARKERGSGSDYVGWSLNSSQLTTNLDSITNADRLGGHEFSTGDALFTVVIRCAAGDVVRPHSRAVMTGTGDSDVFAIVTRVS
jgi:hypothetical protein